MAFFLLQSFTHVRIWLVFHTLYVFSVSFLDSLQWRHSGCDGISNHQPRHCLLNRLFRRTSKITSKLRVTGLCAGNSPVTGEFPAQMASNAENVSIWWRRSRIILWQGALPSVDYIRSWHNLDVFLIKRYRGVIEERFSQHCEHSIRFIWHGAKMRARIYALANEEHVMFFIINNLDLYHGWGNIYVLRNVTH